MNQLWPSVNLYVKQIVRDSIQPALKENLEKFKLFGFKFERIILGTVVSHAFTLNVFIQPVFCTSVWIIIGTCF